MERAVQWHEMVLYVIAAGSAVFGIFALVWPVRMASAVGLQLQNAGAHSEIRAIYGGMLVAMAAVIIIGLLRQDGSWLLSMALLFFGLVAGRVLSLAADGFSKMTVALGLVEAVTAGLLLFSAGYLNRS